MVGSKAKTRKQKAGDNPAYRLLNEAIASGKVGRCSFNAVLVRETKGFTFFQKSWCVSEVFSSIGAFNSTRKASATFNM